jgi:hypothetical protein
VLSDELWALAVRNGGVFSRLEARPLGVADRQLAKWCLNGEIARVGHGVFAVGRTRGPAIDVAALCATHRVVVSHISAAAWLAADAPTPSERLHITMSRNRRWRTGDRDGLRVHRSDLAPDEIWLVRGVPVTSPRRTAIDVCRSEPIETAVAIVDALIRAKLLIYEQFIADAAATRGTDSSAVRRAATLVSPVSGSILESLTRVLMWQHGIGEPVPQYPFTHPRHGLVGYVDFAWPDHRARGST